MSADAPDNKLPDVFTFREAARYLQMSERNLRRHIYELGDLTPDANPSGKMLLFTRVTLDAFRVYWQAHLEKARGGHDIST